MYALLDNPENDFDKYEAERERRHRHLERLENEYERAEQKGDELRDELMGN
jgi:hypothetical protein